MRKDKTTIYPSLTFNLKVDFTFSVPSLGIMSISKAPCKGKSFVYYPAILKLLPLQGERFVSVITQGAALG